MILTIPNEVAVAFLKSYDKPECMDDADHWQWRDGKTMDSRLFERAELAGLRATAMEVSAKSKGSKHGKAANTLATDIGQLFAVEDSDGSKPVKYLKVLPEAIHKFFDDLPHRWLVRAVDSKFNPRVMVAGLTAKYTPAEKTRDDYRPAFVTVFFRWWERGSHEHTSIHIGAQHCDNTVAVILHRFGFTAPSKEILAEHAAQVARFDEWRIQLGEQFLSSGYAQPDGNSYGWSRRGKNEIRLSIEGSAARLICDDVETGSEDDDKEDSDKPRTIMVKLAEEAEDKEDGVETALVLPVNPVIRFFDLGRDQFCKVHVVDVEPYVYDEKLIDKLVLPAEHKKLIGTLLHAGVDESNKLGDIVRGKGGGTTILCHGTAGTGKTLTAECFSECVKRPMYAVQCAQLGLDVGTVEKNLNTVLGRASRWRAVLLIDEADVYIIKRGNDMVQNAVIGTFLRVLEYFEGIMFMTTNRGDDVDDAIRSRCIAEISYGVPPEHNDRVALWRILSTHYGLNLTTKLIEALVKKFPHCTGRDVKQLCRLARVNSGLSPTLANFEAVAVYKPGGFEE